MHSQFQLIYTIHFLTAASF